MGDRKRAQIQQIARQHAYIEHEHIRADKTGRLLTDTIFNGIFANESYCILIRISTRFVPRGSINNMTTLLGNQPLSFMNLWTYDGLVYSRIYSSLGLDELRNNIIAMYQWKDRLKPFTNLQPRISSCHALLYAIAVIIGISTFAAYFSEKLS